MASDRIGDAAEAHREQSALKRKLAWRMAFAGLMIVVLLGTLGLFDYLTSKGEPDSALPGTAQPVPEDRKDVTQPVKIAEQSLELGKEVQAAAEPEGSAAPVDKSSPLVEALPRPLPAAPTLPRAVPPEAKPEARNGARVPPHSESKNSLPAHPAVAPAPPLPAPASIHTPAQPAPPPRTPVSAQPAPPPRASVATQTAPPARTVQAPPVQAGTPTPREESYPAPKPAPPRLFSGYALQAGVFTDVRLAEELHAKLTLNGIPSTLEIQVNVGPFKTREEADAARAKMSVLGLDSVLHLPKGVKR